MTVESRQELESRLAALRLKQRGSNFAPTARDLAEPSPARKSYSPPPRRKHAPQPPRSKTTADGVDGVPWEGIARMAWARVAAGVETNDIDALAMKRYPEADALGW